MNAKNTEYFERELMRLRSQLLSRANHPVDPGDVVGADGVPDFADYAAKSAEVEVSDRISDSEANLLRKLELAFKRLGDGDYDKCAECGGNITIERLRAKPTVSLCVTCQEEKESSMA